MWVNLLSYALSGVILYVNFWIKGLENVLVMLKKKEKTTWEAAILSNCPKWKL